MSIGIAVCGVGGRVGKALLHACAGNSDFRVAAALTSSASPLVGQPSSVIGGPADVTIAGSFDGGALQDVDVCIDFTTAVGSIVNARVCAAAGKPIVIGTTGFDGPQKQALRELAKSVAMVVAPNMSVGVNVCFSLLAQAARILGDDYEVEILEAHHRNKVDAPSGTALKMGEVVAQALGRDLQKNAVFARQGHTGPRSKHDIGFQTLRAGDIVGEHTVMFAGEGERIEIAHRSTSRANYAQGALRAAQWVRNAPPGFYDMQDVLSLR